MGAGKLGTNTIRMGKMMHWFPFDAWTTNFIWLFLWNLPVGTAGIEAAT